MNELRERGDARRLDSVVGGKYRIVRFLAAGGMGSVWEAQHTLVRRRFAVKFLHPDLAERRELLARFQREAEAAGALESENVAAAIDFGIAQDGAPYIVLEYLNGESLETLLAREQRLPAARAVNLVQQACRGVQAAHAAGIVHRDLKPHNLFVCRREDGTDLLKVLDFGIAKLDVNQSGVATRTGTVLGTPAYMSPEQARGEKDIDTASDIYALGAILYELLSGEKPHPGDSHNAILHHIATQPALSLAAVCPDLPAGLVGVVEQALAGERSARPASAEALGQALAPWARAEVWPAPPAERSSPRNVAVATTLPAVPSSGQPERASSPELARESAPAVVAAAERRRVWPLAAVAAALVGVFVLARATVHDEPAPAANAVPAPVVPAVRAEATPAAAVKTDTSPPLANPPAAPPTARAAVPALVPAPVQPLASAPHRLAAAAKPLVTAVAPAAPPSRASTGSAGRPGNVEPAKQNPAVTPARPAPEGLAPVAFDQDNPYR